MPISDSSVAARTSIQRNLGEPNTAVGGRPIPKAHTGGLIFNYRCIVRFLPRYAHKNTSWIVVAMPPTRHQSPGARILSTRASIDAGGGGVNFETTVATTKLSTIPTAPMPSGEMPNSQYSATFRSGRTNLKKTM